MKTLGDLTTCISVTVGGALLRGHKRPTTLLATTGVPRSHLVLLAKAPDEIRMNADDARRILSDPMPAPMTVCGLSLQWGKAQ